MEALVRIDRGIARGKRPKYKHTSTARHPDRGTWQIPEDLDPHEVLQRYITSDTTSQIAVDYGVSRKALTKWLRSKLPKEWKEAQIIRALAMKDDGENGIYDAQCALSLARGRELVRSAQFDLQALDQDYQPKQQVTVDVNHHVQVDLALSEQAGQLLAKIRDAGMRQVAVQQGEVIDVVPEQRITAK